MSLIPLFDDTDYFNELNTNINRLLQRFDQPFNAPMIKSTVAAPTRFLPAMDFIERDKDYLVQTELPGMPKEAIKIDLVNNRLSIKAETSQDTEKNEGKWHLKERSYGKFERSVMIPQDADAESVGAKYENGVLEVTIPKKSPKETGKKTIAIQ